MASELAQPERQQRRGVRRELGEQSQPLRDPICGEEPLAILTPYRRQAELQSENSDAWAAYRSERNAYGNAMAEIVDLKREVAYQHNVVTQLLHQLAMSGGNHARSFSQTAYAPQPRAHAAVAKSRTRAAARSNDVAMVSYGWGQL